MVLVARRRTLEAEQRTSDARERKRTCTVVLLASVIEDVQDLLLLARQAATKEPSLLVLLCEVVCVSSWREVRGVLPLILILHGGPVFPLVV